MRRWVCCLLAVGSLACQRGSAQQRASAGAPTPLGVHGPFELREGGRTHLLGVGRANIGVDDVLLVDLSDAPFPASGAPSTGNQVGFALPAGPGRSYFTGGEIDVPVGLSIPSRQVSGNVVETYRARVSVAPFRRAVGEHVRGTLYFAGRVTGTAGDVRVAGGDAFDVVLTAIYGDRDGTAPTAAATTPVAGQFEQTAFTAASTVVTFSTASDGTKYVDAVWFFAARGVTCDGVYNARGGNHLAVTSPAMSVGGEGLAPIVGRAVPVDPTFHYGNGAWSEFLFGYSPPAWLRFDSLTLREGTTARGSVYAANLRRAEMVNTVRPGHIEGTFTARVCARRADPVLPPPPAPPAPPPAPPS